MTNKSKSKLTGKTHTVRLNARDKRVIRQVVRDQGKNDERFKTETAAIRYYVKVGIAAEKSTQDLEYNLNSRLVRDALHNSTKKDYDDFKIIIQKQADEAEQINAKLYDYFTEANIKNQRLENMLIRCLEKIEQLEKTVDDGFERIEKW